MTVSLITFKANRRKFIVGSHLIRIMKNMTTQCGKLNAAKAETVGHGGIDYFVF